jgi:hypothetical protein
MLAFVLAAPASAGVREPAPAGAGETVRRYSVGGAHHLALLTSQGAGGTAYRLALSADAGRSFATMAFDPAWHQLHDATVDADGRRWVTGSRAGVGVEVVTTAPDGVSKRVALLPSGARVTGPVAAHGTHWAAVERETGPLLLYRVTPDGPDGTGTPLGAGSCSTTQLLVDGRGLWVRCSDAWWVVGADGVASPAAYSPDLGVLGADLRELAGRLWRPSSAEIWRAVPELDAAPRELQPAAGGAIALLHNGRRVLIETPLADYGARGPLEPDTQTMIATANEIRTQQGLPPLVGDPVVSQASRSHARYQARWQSPGLGAHDEELGKAGATGRAPGERCRHFGTECGTEIMHGFGAAESVRDWWVTALHRSIVGTPALLAAGGGMAGTASSPVAVMNDAPGEAVPVTAIGLPRGTWKGATSFVGELPDPGEPCGMSDPYGVAQTAYAYVDPQTSAIWTPGPITLFDVTTGQAVKGCSRAATAPLGLGDVRWSAAYNAPAGPLPAGRTYRASTIYASPGAGPRPFSWTFTVTGGAADITPISAPRPARCLRVRAPARVSAKALRRGVKVTVRACRATKLRVQLRGRFTRTVSVRANRDTRVVVRARVKAGTYTLRVSAGRDSASRSVRVRR